LSGSSYWVAQPRSHYIGGIERAERQPSATTLARLAQALGVKPSDLLALAERRD